MLISEFISTNDLFGNIETVYPFDFIEGDAEVLNIMLVAGYGLREIAPPYYTLNVDQLSKVIVKHFKARWLNYGIMDSLVGGEKTKTVVESITDSAEHTSTKSDVNKVSGYNSDELIDESGNTSTNTDNNVDSKDRTLTETYTDPIKKYGIMKGHNSDIMNLVFSDIVNLITFKIY